MSRWFVVLTPLAACAAFAFAQHEFDPHANKIAKASDDALKTLKRMQIPKGLAAELWAAEPLLANPVAFCFDEKGRIFVAETFRLHTAVTDNRGHMKWLDDELALRTVPARVEMYKKYNYRPSQDHDRVRMLFSSTGSGKPDKATIFADGFNRPEDGLGSGVLAHHGSVYFTCIPDLWLLKDTKGDGKADVKKSLHTGYGVHVSFIGHDSHGLKIGPDGKLYFSIGDRGFHVETEGRTVSDPDTGAVFRCNLDGSELEVVHTGLRNPQELVFDKYGNLFTGDNNADGGDQARLTHIVDGGDSGWRIGHQYLPGLGTWNSEKTWQPNSPQRSAYFVPPIINLGNGPSGFTYNPGVTLLPEKYQDNFFLCDFRGSAGNSTIHNFTLKPKGASFELDKRESFVSAVLATDCDFAPDGGFYVLDWVEGWGLTGKGRVFKVTDPEKTKDAAVTSTQEILGAGMAQRSLNDLSNLLAHDDMRVRLEAQFALAQKNAQAELETAAKSGKTLLARLHAIWGLGQLGRKNPEAVKGVVALLDDPEIEVRANAAKVLGESRYVPAEAKLVKLLKDDSPRVKFHAAMAAGRVGSLEVVPALFDVLQANNDADAYLRHAAVVGLASIKDAAPVLAKAAENPNLAVRLGAVLALRKLAHTDAGKFLDDAEPKIVLEAARAAYDTPIPEAIPQLARIIDRPLPDPAKLPANQTEALLRRIVAAHYRIGTPDAVAAVANVAAKANVPDAVRIEAVKLLQKWEKPSGRDPIVGVWRPLPERSGDAVAMAVKTVLPGLMTGSDKLRTESAKLAAQHGIKEVGPMLRSIVTDASKPVQIRLETFKALEALKDPGLKETAKAVAVDPDGRMRHQARRVMFADANPDKIVEELAGVLDGATIAEKQGAIAWLADLKAGPADAVLGKWIGRIASNEAPAEIQLDILDAAVKRKSEPAIAKSLAFITSSKNAKDDLAEFRVALAGGDAEAGKRLFFEKTELACMRCHKVQGVGGEVGPELAGLNKRGNREYILEALVLPNKQIAKGYETVVLVLDNGQVKSGILKGEDQKEVRLMTPEGQIIAIPTASIEDRSRGPSAMPADLIQKMSRRELRDLVEYLSGL
jgi:quinoprotein glucose dehydrogenase